jgi:Ca2+-binding RTX toxin-like protein
LLQDIAVPSHSHSDPHLEGFGAFDDPDPFHDWADGVAFSTSGAGDLPVAAFNEPADADRAANWALDASDDSSLLRSARDIFAAFAAGTADPDPEPLYRLFQASAALSDNYDTKDYNGQVDAGARRNQSADYDNWTRAELVQLAEILIPRSIVDTAELYRYFHGVVDAIAPLVALPGLTSGDANAPQLVGGSVNLQAAATDQTTGDSGVGKGLFVFEARQQLAGGGFGAWQPISMTGATAAHFANGAAFGPEFANRHGASSAVAFTGDAGALYEIRVTAEDGAGNLSTSSTRFVRFAGAVVVNNELIVTGGPANDNIELLTPSAGVVEARLNGVSLGSFNAASVSALGGGGNDSIVMRPSRFNLPVVFRGGAGADSMIGGYANDQLHGDEGDDFLVGDRGNDEIWGGPGRDKGYGRLGNDVLHGGDDNDQLRGDLGDDLVFGDLGKDTVRGDAGNDVVHGNDGGDRLYGYEGRDVLIGGLGVDFAVGGLDDDVLIDGPTTHDANIAALVAILAEWSSAKAYADRVQNLINGGGAGPRLNGSFFISPQTTRDDRRADMLYGELGQDWFPRNEALDAEAGEQTGM